VLQVAELVFDCQPEAYAALFMTSKADNVMLWFDHFTQDSRGHFQYGAKALAQYALRKREEVRFNNCCHPFFTYVSTHMSSTLINRNALYGVCRSGTCWFGVLHMLMLL
jgi:hypothetical protein